MALNQTNNQDASGNEIVVFPSAQPVTLPVTPGQKAMAASLPVTIASDQGPLPVTAASSSTGTITSVPGSASTGVLLAANANRRGFSIFNDSTAVLRVAFAATASNTAFSVLLQPNAFFENSTLYTGVVSGLWASAAGNARVTEFT